MLRSITESTGFKKFSSISMERKISSNSVAKLFKKASEEHNRIFYINRLNMVDSIGYINEKDVNIPLVAEAKLHGIAKTQKPGRLLAAFQKADQTVHFFIAPNNPEQLQHVRTEIRTAFAGRPQDKRQLNVVSKPEHNFRF